MILNMLEKSKSVPINYSNRPKGVIVHTLVVGKDLITPKYVADDAIIQGDLGTCTCELFSNFTVKYIYKKPTHFTVNKLNHNQVFSL